MPVWGSLKALPPFCAWIRPMTGCRRRYAHSIFAGVRSSRHASRQAFTLDEQEAGLQDALGPHQPAAELVSGLENGLRRRRSVCSREAVPGSALERSRSI